MQYWQGKGSQHSWHTVQKNPSEMVGGLNAIRSQLHLRLLRRRDRYPNRSVGRGEPRIRRGLSSVLPTKCNSCQSRRGWGDKSVGGERIATTMNLRACLKSAVGSRSREGVSYAA